jgi:hypothetical protein
MDSIHYLKYQQIDKQKWDDCINRSVNRLIYPKSFYLDTMAANWDAIVLNDYEAVMPLTWKKKWGIAYLYQPAFIQQGGIFYTTQLSAATQKLITDKAFEKFKFAEITFNYFNNLSDLNNVVLSTRTNFILPLTKSYNEIYAAYPGSVTKNLNRTKTFGLAYHESNDFMNVLHLYEKLYTKVLPYFSSTDFYNFGLVCKKMFDSKQLIIRKVSNAQSELLSAVVLLIDNNRLYNIISCVTPTGRDKEANYFLYDKLIQEFSGSAFILDFEGSDVKGIAGFYKQFQATNQPYPFCKINRLNPFIKLFKR